MDVQKIEMAMKQWEMSQLWMLHAVQTGVVLDVVL
jgi:hypothetical protein